MPNAGSVVALTLGAIFGIGGTWALVNYLQCSAIFPGGFAGICGTEESAAVFAWVIGLFLIIIAGATWNRKPKSRRRKAAAGGD